MKRLARFVAIALLVTASLSFQAPAQGSSEAAFQPYESCKLDGGLSVVETAPLDLGITSRTVQTLIGPQTIPMLEGRRVMFAYPGEDFYANVKVERLPAESWAQSRSTLIEGFDYLLASGDDARNYRMKPQMNGFAVQGEDRQKREGGVLGFYLLFEDATHMVVTIYFLNQEPAVRFKTMKEYGVLRNSFLSQYTACIRKGLAVSK